MYFGTLSNFSGTHWTALARLTRDFHPLRFTQITPFACDGPRPHRGRFNARTRGQAYHYPDMRVIAPSPPRLVVRPAAAPPVPPHVGIVAGCFRTAFPSGRISNVSSGPIQFSNCCQPAQIRRSGKLAENGRSCRNTSQFETYSRRESFPSLPLLRLPKVILPNLRENFFIRQRKVLSGIFRY